MENNELLEKLADLEHQQWMHWAQTIIQTEPRLNEDRRFRWQKYFIPYNELPEKIKEFDREYARKVLEIIQNVK